jgi:hypothetical protein
MMSPEFEFKVGEHTYRATRMNAFEQFEVARLLRNVLTGLALIEEEVEKAAKKTKKPQPKPSPHNFVQLMCNMAGGLTETESNNSIALCLSKVQRSVQSREGGVGWSSIQVADNNQRSMMFADIEMSQMLEIVWHVVKNNGLIDFFAVSPSNSQATEPALRRDGQDSPTNETGSSAPRSRVSATGSH